MDISEIYTTHEVRVAESVEESTAINFWEEKPGLGGNDVTFEVTAEIDLQRIQIDVTG